MIVRPINLASGILLSGAFVPIVKLSGNTSVEAKDRTAYLRPGNVKFNDQFLKLSDQFIYATIQLFLVALANCAVLYPFLLIPGSFP